MRGGLSLFLLLHHQTKLEEGIDDYHLHLVHNGWCKEIADAIRECMLLTQPAVVSEKGGRREGRGGEGRVEKGRGEEMGGEKRKGKRRERGGDGRERR